MVEGEWGEDTQRTVQREVIQGGSDHGGSTKSRNAPSLLPLSAIQRHHWRARKKVGKGACGKMRDGCAKDSSAQVCVTERESEGVKRECVHVYVKEIHTGQGRGNETIQWLMVCREQLVLYDTLVKYLGFIQGFFSLNHKFQPGSLSIIPNRL